MPRWLILAAFAGALSALFGGYWDDAWHTERGRDSFFIAPHVLIYAGVGGVGGALTVWVLAAARRVGLRAALARPPVLLAAISVAATLASGPVDEAWHRAFGRDAVIWSPPHMLGIVGTMVLGAALLYETRLLGRAWSVATGGLVLAAASFVVAEYDTDVPQFDAVWYLPALALAASLALGLVRMLVSRPWAASEAAAAHLGFILLTTVFLETQDFGPPALPLLVVPALALDVAWTRRRPAPLAAVAFTLALFAVYVPVRNALGDGVELSVADLAVGFPVAVAAVWASLALAGPKPRRRPAAALPASLLLFLLLPAGPALAHDPGQGDSAGSARLTVAADDYVLSARGALNRRSCGSLSGGRLVARRAGVERSARLRVEGCRFSGVVRVDGRGRWFVYAELNGGGRRIETWLPVDAGRGRQRVSDDDRFAYLPRRDSSTATEIAGGAILYGAMLSLLLGAFALLRPRGPGPEGGDPAS